MSKTEYQAQFDELFSQHRDKVYRICYAYLYNPELADDLFQEVMINVWNSLPKFKGQANITTWLYRITVNTAITFNKKEKKKQELWGKELPADMEEDRQESQWKQEREKQFNTLHACIQQLPQSERVIISLLLEDLPYKEIAEVVGMSVSNVGVKINRIKKRMASMMAKENRKN